MISIIVPVYNAEQFLQNCIESILKQTCTDFELICVDNGSTDGSLMILQSYAKKDDRIRVIAQTDLGPFVARKVGAEMAKGDYVSFVDADDWIALDMYENLVELKETFNCDMVCSGLYRAIGDNVTKDGNTILEGFYNEEQLRGKVWPYMLCDGRFFKMGVRPNLVGKLVRRDLFLEACKDAPTNVVNGEDLMVTYLCLLSAKRVYLSDGAWYFYRQHPDSISQRLSNDKEKQSARELFRFLKEQFNRHELSDKLIIQLQYFMAHLLVQRELESFDETIGELRAFGGISNCETIALYAAGRFGKQVNAYLNKYGYKVIWVDKQALEYQKQGLNVGEVGMLQNVKFEKLLVGVIDEEMAASIVKELQSQGIDGNIIKCLDVGYITSNDMMQKLGLVD